jgi:para-nitrobenzyl esterase
MRRAVLALFAFAFAASPAFAAKIAIRIEQGVLDGETEDDVQVFKDIPFAAPPVGELRWRAPQQAPAWTDARDATEFGPICAQNERVTAFMPKLPQSEDCLTLNVWSPNTTSAAKLPVMVWIYGGGFLNGGSAAPIYDGTDLAKHGVVMVSFNYRLGEFGFFAHPAVLGESRDAASGNFGLLDQIAALKWVQKNIAAFGGDPSNVTIFGESAGGVSVNDLIASPMARGLFAKAISESGLGLNEVPTLAEAQRNSVDFATQMGVAGSDAAALANLRALKVEDILKNQGTLATEGHVAPFVDGKVIPSDISVLFAKGEIARVPYIAGSNSNEASLAPALGADPEKGLAVFGDALPKVREIYEADGPLTNAEFAREVFGDGLFTSAAQALAGFVAKTGEPARVYHFAYVADHYKGKMVGVSHGGEIAYVFGLRGLGFIANFASDKDRSVVAQTQAYWTNFARTGDPNGPGLPAWPSFSQASRQTLVIDDTTKAVADFRKGQVGVMTDRWGMRVGMTAP